MSHNIQKAIWKIELQPNLKFILQAMADFADKDGKGIFPAVETVASMTCYTVRNCRRLIKQLVKMGYLILRGKRKKTNLYDLNMEKLIPNPTSDDPLTPDKLSPLDEPSNMHQIDDKLSSIPDKLSPLPLTNCPKTPDKLSPDPITEPRTIDPVKEGEASPAKMTDEKVAEFDAIKTAIQSVLEKAGYGKSDTYSMAQKIGYKFRDYKLLASDVVPLMREAYQRIKAGKHREPEIGEYLWKTHFIEYKKSKQQAEIPYGSNPNHVLRPINFTSSPVKVSS